MTVQSQKSKIEHVSLADQDTFTYDFVVTTEADINVLVDGEPYEGAIDVTGVGNPLGGDVILETGQAEGAAVVIYRQIALTQEVDYQAYDEFPAETHEGALDKLTLLIQQLNEYAIGAIRFPIAEVEGPNSFLPPISERALKYLFFDANGGVTVSDGTAIGGEGVKSVTARADSSGYIGVDQADVENPQIFVITPNGVNTLVATDALGKVPESVLPNDLVRSVDVEPGSVDMIDVDNTDANNPLVGVKEPVNQPLSLIQLSAVGTVPLELLPAGAFRNFGVFRGDDLCDKEGDGPGECTAPDKRNPSQRFTELADDFVAGDLFIITMFPGEASGTMNLFAAPGDSATSEITVNPGDAIVYVDAVLDGVTTIIYEGWYHIPDFVQITDATSVTYDPTGNVIIQPADINVDLALTRLDGNVLPLAGGTLTGQVKQALAPVAADDLANKQYVDDQKGLVDADVAALDARVTTNEGDIATNTADLANKIERDTWATELLGGTVKVRVTGNDGFITTDGSNP